MEPTHHNDRAIGDGADPILDSSEVAAMSDYDPIAPGNHHDELTFVPARSVVVAELVVPISIIRPDFVRLTSAPQCDCLIGG